MPVLITVSAMCMCVWPDEEDAINLQHKAQVLHLLLQGPGVG